MSAAATILALTLAAGSANRPQVEPMVAERSKALSTQHGDRHAPANVDAESKAGPRLAVQAARPQTGPSTSTNPVQLEPAPDGAAHERVQNGGVTSFPGAIGLNGDATFTASGLVAGRTYVFEATGKCVNHGKVRAVRSLGGVTHVRIRSAHIDGLDFRVQFGTRPSRSLSVGQGKEEEDRIPFVADSPSMTIRVFDESSLRGKERVTCTVSGFRIRPQ